MRSHLENYLTDPLLYWFENDRAAEVKAIVESYELDAETAVAVLQRLDGLKWSIEIYNEVSNVNDKHDDKNDKGDSQDEGQKHNEIKREKREHVDWIDQWPDQTPARVAIRSWLLKAAGDQYKPPSNGDSSGGQDHDLASP